MSENETLIYHGGAVKALGDGKVGGYLVRFTNPDDVDLEGEYFDAGTDFGSATGSDAYYAHGLDVKLGTRVIGSGAFKADDVGVWIDAQLEMRDEYEQAIYELAQAGKLGWSSGTAAHLVEKEEKGGAVHITKWPLGLDASLTPTPAEPRNAAMPIKSFAESAKSLLEVQPEDTGEVSVSTVEVSADTVNIVVNEMPETEQAKTEVKNMSDEQTPITRVEVDEALEQFGGTFTAELDGVKDSMKGTSDKIDKILDALSNAGPLKDAGYIAPDSEKDKPATKSFADWLMAVKNKNVRRLKSVYPPDPEHIKAMGEQSGTTGGYLVPTEYHNRLMAMAQEMAVIRPRAFVLPVSTNRGEVPALDQTAAPTAGVGQSAFAGGVVAAWTPEAGTLSEQTPTFSMVEYNINKLGGYTLASNEQVSDSGQSVEALLTRLFGMAIAAMEDYAFIRGTGAGQPLGILAAPCTIGITTTTNNQFAIEDGLKMLARFWPAPGDSPIWILQRALIPDLYSYWDVATSGTDAIQPREGLPSTLLGYPYVFSEHMPAADSDDAILASLGAYIIFDRQGIQIAYSEHSAFLTDQATWRFTKRLDGQPWLKEAITLADPGGATTVSPFLYHDD